MKQQPDDFFIVDKKVVQYLNHAVINSEEEVRSLNEVIDHLDRRLEKMDDCYEMMIRKMGEKQEETKNELETVKRELNEMKKELERVYEEMEQDDSIFNG
uniref:Transcriptional regulator n=1 Tax=Caenorhabditis tropicalis TaxID=1561998 RepID=A0A1I7T359_9PELO